MLVTIVNRYTIVKKGSLMNIFHTSLIFLCSIALLLNCTPTQLSFTPPFTVTGLATKTTFFVQDAVGRQFVLKYHPRGPKRAIHDTLGAYVGKSIGLHINEVEIFSPHHPFNQLFNDINPLEPSQFRVTTLHTRVPGTSVKSIKKINNEICIKRGLCKEKHLESLTKYMQLCDMVAFDIFIENTDRHNRNLFIDVITGEFYAIDMDHGFKSALALVNIARDYDFDTLAVRVYEFVKMLQKQKLSSQEIKVLKRIHHTLQRLVDLYPPAILFDEWMAIAQKGDVVYSPREQKKIKKYLEYNAQEVCRLISLLDTFF